MDMNYIKEGYELMTTYITEQRIKTKNRTFLRRLNKFYDAHKMDEVLSEDVLMEYLELEKHFYNNIITPVSDDEKESTELLNIITQGKME